MGTPPGEAGSWGRFVFGVVGIYGSFLSWGALQERITSYRAPDTGERFGHTALLNLLFYASSLLLALVGMRSQGRGLSGLAARYPSRARFGWAWGRIGLSNTLASALGYASLDYIPYPVHLLAKSSKLIPVMLAGALINKKRYTGREIGCVLLITAGVFVFSFSPKAGAAGPGGTASTWIGLGLVLANLCCDGFTNGSQDAERTERGVSNWEMMFCTNAPGVALLLIRLCLPIADPAGAAALAFLYRNPSLYKLIAGFAVCGALGQCFVFYTIYHFGSLSCQTITLTRKAIQILLSVLLFGHQISPTQWLGCAMVFGGLFLKQISRQHQHQKQQ